jgi:hypothetical protein
LGFAQGLWTGLAVGGGAGKRLGVGPKYAKVGLRARLKYVKIR